MKQVLLVDEDKSIRDTLKAIILKNFPDQVKIAEAIDGLEAIRKIEKQKYDCVVTDMKLPKIEGDSLLKMMTTLPTDFKPVNILILSSYNAEASGYKQIVSHLSKPVDSLAFITYFAEKVLNLYEKAPPQVDVNFINPFIDSTIEVLKMMADIDIDKEKVTLKNSGQISGDISSIVAITCSKFSGSFAISFDKACFIDIAGKMLGEDYTEITADNQDAASEICNQVFGLTKAMLNDEFGLDIAKAIPTLIVGDKHIIKHQVQGPCISVRFKTPKGHLCIEAVIR